MSYAVLEKDIERLDESQLNVVTQFVRFLLSQNASPSTALPPSRKETCRGQDDSLWEAFDRIRAKSAIDHSNHEWTMEEIDEEIAASRKERREYQRLGATA